ncbi:MAG: substrate-binding domain-containing protein [Clostridium sp.]|nr:substrate-binding domain-containing protein [Clostridium sp.]
MVRVKRKSLIILSILILAILSITVCGIIYKKNRTQREFIIGMSQSNLYEPWRILMNKEVKDEADKHDNIKVIYKDAGGDIEKQKRDIDDLIDFGSDLLIVSINEYRELMPKVREAYGKVPVIVLDRAVEGGDYSTFIGVDRELIGEQAGSLLNNLAVDGEKIKVVEVQGMLDSKSDIEIRNGFKKSIKDNCNISIDRTIVANWNKNEAQDKIQELLNENSDINAIFTHSDYMALGASYAVKNSGRSDIKIIGVDGLEGKENGIDLVGKGDLYSTFTCRTGGKEAIEYALKILNGDKNIPKKIFLPSDNIGNPN